MIGISVTYLIVEDLVFRVALDEIIGDPLDVAQDIFILAALFIGLFVFYD